MNTLTSSELYSTSVLGVFVIGGLALNGMASAVAFGTLIAAAAIATTYMLSNK
ncbi:hypothetical protein [Pseudoalteromonas denitrificans]|uniref:Uncharacterized protein n=1 Tax=Pseudoalteromonas denitrificans DSM 6059 TaxID=1123010 RepID=A0A1I1PLJ9_9GAMM|nr:hypothetical protein [Pseudoalteromonas denitrificans]SFD10759.1 hypothetical protein SAMN02745724_03499 [Pseudoalteromonas denitrificans DSM 6059]